MFNSEPNLHNRPFGLPNRAPIVGMAWSSTVIGFSKSSRPPCSHSFKCLQPPDLGRWHSNPQLCASRLTGSSSHDLGAQWPSDRLYWSTNCSWSGIVPGSWTCGSTHGSSLSLRAAPSFSFSFYYGPGYLQWYELRLITSTQVLYTSDNNPMYHRVASLPSIMITPPSNLMSPSWSVQSTPRWCCPEYLGCTNSSLPNFGNS